MFLAKTKDQAAKKFEHFLTWFERRFDCRIQVLRTDRGLEYRNHDPFFQKTGVARQLTEQDSSASNDKAERMLRAILNMARCTLLRFADTLLGRSRKVCVLCAQPKSMSKQPWREVTHRIA